MCLCCCYFLLYGFALLSIAEPDERPEQWMYIYTMDISCGLSKTQLKCSIKMYVWVLIGGLSIAPPAELLRFRFEVLPDQEHFVEGGFCKLDM